MWAGNAAAARGAAWHEAILRGTARGARHRRHLRIHSADGELHYALAGHPPPLLWRRASGHVETLDCAGPALGVIEEASFEICGARLEPGDALLLYTDGAIEARAPDGTMVEVEGLARYLHRHAALPPAEIVSQLAEEIAAGREIRDDVTLVVIKRALE